MKMMGESWAELGSRIAGLMFIWATIQQFFPSPVRAYLEKLRDKLLSLINPFVQITVQEYSGDRRNEVYVAIESYLGAKSTVQARRLKADMVKNSKSFVLSLDKSEEVTDEFNGAKLWWVLRESARSTPTISLYRSAPEEKKYYTLSFHRKDREIVSGPYLSYVMEEGKALELKNRQRKLYTNKTDSWGWGGKSLWNHIVFEHPASFRTLAMDPRKKQEIIDDLLAFTKSKEYYAKVGKAWKRGYLLYGPPGTGKSTMIAAMANFLNYDVYDLELTSVKNNSDLRKLLVGTSSKSIIVIEDIDCSLDLTGKRKKKKKGKSDQEEEKEDPLEEKEKEKEEDGSKVTLSGLLNFIDGIWSACGPERIIVFTTNHKEKLDPALIRRGRMDMHIEMSYCKFEAFKVLAKNYLDIDSHPLFETVGRLLEETSMSPCDVAENLIPKTASKEVETCLNNLVEALNEAKETARVKAEKEAKTKRVSSKSKTERRFSHWMKMIGKVTKKNDDCK